MFNYKVLQFSKFYLPVLLIVGVYITHVIEQQHAEVQSLPPALNKNRPSKSACGYYLTWSIQCTVVFARVEFILNKERGARVFDKTRWFKKNAR